MDKWKRHFVLLVAVSLAFLSTISADIPDFDDEDDAITVESEQVEHPSPYEPDDTQAQYDPPQISPGKFHYFSHFDEHDEFNARWIKSEAKKTADDAVSKYDGVWALEAPERVVLRNDLGLVLKSKARHSAISSRLVKPFVFTDKPLIVQYEVQLQNGQECGGAYLKLLSSGKETTDLKEFHDKTPYTIMFGPDKCGNDHKLHFIFRHVNPINATIEEKHCKKPKERIDEYFGDKKPHLYQLIIRPDNSFTISVDHKVVNEGSLLTDFNPAVNPPKEINDPTDFKPQNWDEREKIQDPSAAKPDDWDENEPQQIPDITATKPDGWLDDEDQLIPDRTAIKPADWDVEMDGDWQAPLVSNPICEKAVGCGEWKTPMVSNPKYRGKWNAPLIDNPNYQGKWAPRRIPNPDFFEDLNPFKMTTISAIGLELWTMSDNILFDNMLITDDIVVAQEVAAVTFDLKRKQMDLDSNADGQPSSKVLVIENKALWWTVYTIYCLIPFAIWFWYLWKRAKEESIIQRILRLTDDKPWLWAVFVLAGGLPLTLFIFFRCFNKDEPKKESIPKKTDEYQVDDQEDEGEVEEEIEIDESEPQSRSRPASKLDLETPLDQDDELENDATESAPKEGTRKRRPRKE